jgi:hypothetical protein
MYRTWVVSFPSRPPYSRGKCPSYPTDRELGRTQKMSSRCGEEKNLLPLPGIELRFLGRRYIDWTIPSTVFTLGLLLSLTEVRSSWITTETKTPHFLCIPLYVTFHSYVSLYWVEIRRYVALRWVRILKGSPLRLSHRVGEFIYPAVERRAHLHSI